MESSVQNFKTFDFYAVVSKIPSGIANSVDPDCFLKIVWAGSTLFAYAFCQKLWCMKF